MINNFDPFIISEIGINHNGKLEDAYKLIDASVRAGASAVKFQTYKTEKRVKKNSPIFDILKNVNYHMKTLKRSKNIVTKKIYYSSPHLLMLRVYFF